MEKKSFCIIGWLNKENDKIRPQWTYIVKYVMREVESQTLPYHKTLCAYHTDFTRYRYLLAFIFVDIPNAPTTKISHLMSLDKVDDIHRQLFLQK